VQAAGLRENRAVGSAVAAGVIADLLSLTVLAIATSVAVLEVTDDRAVVAAQPDPPLPVWAALPIIAAVALFVIPRIARWFFVEIGHSRTQRFVFALAAMAGASALATWGGVEGLIGAFLVGLGLNRLVPKSGSLFDRIEFVGSSIFIPAFLVSIGLSIDPRLLFDVGTLTLAAVFTALVVVGKLAAAVTTGLVFKLQASEVGIMATLSMGQAASTLAISQVGVSLGLFDRRISNAAVIAIVAAVFITSYGTRFFIPRVERPTFARPPLGEHLLVDTGSASPELMVDLACSIAAPDQGLVRPFVITTARDADSARSRVDAAVAAATARGNDADGAVRFDDSPIDGTLQLGAEVDASMFLVQWPARAGDIVFGSEIDLLGERSDVPVAAAHLVQRWQRVVAATGDMDTDWKADDARLAMSVARRVAAQGELPLLLHTPNAGLGADVVREDEDVEVIVSDTITSSLANTSTTDLLVLPAHALREAGALGPWRIVGAVRDRSVLVVAGPHRLTISARSMRRPVHGLVGDRA
jgi:hypothetical protein